MPETQTIIYYDLEFEKYTNQIQDGYYSEKAYVCYYYKGLADQIKKQLMSYQLPNSLKTIQYVTQVINDQYWDYQCGKGGKTPNALPTKSFSSYI